MKRRTRRLLLSLGFVLIVVPTAGCNDTCVTIPGVGATCSQPAAH